MHELKLRSSLRSGNVSRISSVVRGVVQDTPLHNRRQGLEGEERTFKVQRTHDGPVDSPNGSWRSDYNLRTEPIRWGRVPHTSPTNPPTVVPIGTPILPNIFGATQAGIVIVEQDIMPSEWHIARCGIRSNVKCAGALAMSNVKCDKPIRTRVGGVPAPCFWGQRKEEIMTRPIKAQFWFCPNRADGCVCSRPRPVVLGHPTTVPQVWPVLRGTTLTQDEADQLSTAGFCLLPHPETPPPGFPLRSPRGFPERRATIAKHAWPKTRAGKSIRRNQPGKSHIRNLEQVSSMIAQVTRSINVPQPGFGRDYTLCTDGSAAEGIVYRVTIL